MKDSYRHKGLRKKLVEDIRAKGFEDERVLAAIGALPRHFFMDKTFEGWAYLDKAFPIGNEQTISQPYTVALQTSLLEIKKGDKILEIGTGSGYQAAILAILGAEVYTLERQEKLYHNAAELLQKMGIKNIRFFLKDGFEGLPKRAPFDKIIVTAGAPKVPEALKQQIKIGGILVIPTGTKTQKMLKITRIAEDEFKETIHGNFKFVPLLKGVKRIED